MAGDKILMLEKCYLTVQFSSMTTQLHARKWHMDSREIIKFHKDDNMATDILYKLPGY